MDGTWQFGRSLNPPKRKSDGMGDSLDDLDDGVSMGLGCSNCGKIIQTGQEHICNGKSEE